MCIFQITLVNKLQISHNTESRLHKPNNCTEKMMPTPLHQYINNTAQPEEK